MHVYKHIFWWWTTSTYWLRCAFAGILYFKIKNIYGKYLLKEILESNKVEKMKHTDTKAKNYRINQKIFLSFLKFWFYFLYLLTGDIGVEVITGWTKGPVFFSDLSEIIKLSWINSIIIKIFLNFWNIIIKDFIFINLFKVEYN